MMQRTVILACMAALTVSALALAQVAQPAALEIVDKSFDPSTSILSFELLNTSDRTITAWRLSLARGDAMGRGHRSLLDVDAYMNLGNAERAMASESVIFEGPIFPGQRLADERQLDFIPDGSSFEALSLKVVAVVFEDTTTQGDAEAALTILEAREARVAEIGRVLELVRGKADRGRGAAARGKAVRKLAEALAAESRDPALAEGMRPEVASRLSAVKAELADTLRRSADEADLNPGRAAQALDGLVGYLEQSHELGRRNVRGAN